MAETDSMIEPWGPANIVRQQRPKLDEIAQSEIEKPIHIEVGCREGEYTQVTYAPGYRLYIRTPLGWHLVPGRERGTS